MISTETSNSKHASVRSMNARRLAIALAGIVCPVLLAAVLIPTLPATAPAPTHTLAVERGASVMNTDARGPFIEPVATTSSYGAFAAPIAAPQPLDDSGHAAISSKEQKKLNGLAKGIAMAKAKLEKREASLELWQSRLLEAQQDLNDALFLPESTKKEKKAKNKAVKKALKRLKKAQNRIDHYLALILKSESLIAEHTADILELDATYFDPEDLQIPSGLTASSTTTQVHFDWDMVEGATGYTLYWSLANDVDLATATTVPVMSSSAVVDGFGEDVTVYAVVTASSGSTESLPSSEISATTGVESGDIQIDIAPNRTLGVAPLAVFFDASETASSATNRPFHELSYAWTFGDDAAGNWSTTGKSRNLARGPVAAHVFESPGIFTVTMVARDAAGALSSEDVTITVQDPDVVYAGFNTVCVSQAGDFSGAPTGSMNVTTASFTEAMSHAGTGKRVLLRRGEAWTVFSKTGINVEGPGTIGAFGSGPKPTITASSPVFEMSNKTPAFDDWRFMDLVISTGGQHNAFEAEGQVRRALILRCDMNDCKRGVEMTDSIVGYWNSTGFPQPIHDAIAVADCTVTNSTQHQIYVAATNLMILGGDFDTCPSSHILRIPYAGKGVISNCHVRGAGENLNELKLHAPNFGDAGALQGKYTEQLVISDNRFESVNTAWSVQPAPQNSTRDERVRDVLIERNHFVSGPNTRVMLNLSATDCTIRSNLFDLSGSPSCAGIAVGPRGIEPIPDGNVVANNTFYRSDSAGLTGVDLADATKNTVVHNNLAYAPSSPGATVLSTGGTGTVSSNNLLSNQLVFVSPSPSAPSDFRLLGGTVAVDGGVLVPGVFTDFDLKTSPTDGDGDGVSQPDVGAFEYD